MGKKLSGAFFLEKIFLFLFLLLFNYSCPNFLPLLSPVPPILAPSTNTIYKDANLMT